VSGVLHGTTVLLLVVPGLLLLARARALAGTPGRRVALELAFGMYIAVLVVVVLFPLRVDAALRADDAVWDYAAFIRDWVNLTPFETVGRLLGRASPNQALRQIGGNIALLAPLGLLGPALFAGLRRPGRMLALALGAALGVEIMQYLARVARLSLRSVDIDDAMLNVIGAMLGFFVWALWNRRAVRS
jgi:glycopeptide antibiotics resistance protein